jgi:uncharacterized phage-like protein YoqJ
MIYAATGHRLQHLPCGFEYKHPWKMEKLKVLEKYLLDNRPDRVISGMAIGWDMWIAWVAIKLDISLSAYVPCEGQESRWSPDHQKQYHWILERSNEIKICAEGSYAAWKMIKRDKDMVDDSDKVLALWNPEKKKGGTYNTVAYAHSVQKDMVNFWEDTPLPAKFY